MWMIQFLNTNYISLKKKTMFKSDTTLPFTHRQFLIRIGSGAFEW